MRVMLSSLFLVAVLVACHDEKTAYREVSDAELREQLMDYNKRKVENEDSLISAFVREYGLDFDISPTGMRYRILNTGGARKVEKGDDVALTYAIHLLDSTPVYASKDNGAFRFTIEQSDAAPGFHELVKRMNYGDSAVTIWPARLGYGIAGDQDRIPLDAILLVDIRILEP